MAYGCMSENLRTREWVSVWLKYIWWEINTRKKQG